jgi:hypothetical protein
MYAPTKSLSAKISQRLLLGIAVAGVMAMDIQIPTATHAATITQENAALQTPNSSTKTLSAPAKPSSAGSRKSHRLVRRPAPLGSSQTGAMSTATLNQAPLTPAISTVPAKTVSLEPGTTSTREGAADKQSPPVSFAAPIAGPLALMQTAPVTSAAAAPSTLMGSAQPSTRVAAAAPSGARGPSLPGRMQRLLSELPGAAQIVAYQEEDPDPTVVTPTLTRNPSVFSFSAVQNGSSPAAQSLTITNTGPGTLAWTASSNSAWLTLNNATSASGTNLGSVGIRVNPAGLSVGTHSGLITIVGTGAANSPQMVTVSFDVTAAPTPTIGLSATTLSFSAVQGGSNPANKTISVSNSGSGTLNWTATENASWLSLSPASGTGSGTISVAVNTSGLSVGTISTPITIAASGATNTPQTVTVSLTITAAAAPPAIGVTPGSLTFTAQQGSGNPTPQSLAVRNTGGGTLTWTVSNNAAWLSHSPTSGTGTGTVTISPVTGSLTAGTYTGAVTLYATGAAAVTIPITFTITAPAAQPTISLSPTSLTFNATAGGNNPSNQTIAITNTGTGSLTWTVTDNANWLTATQSGNSVVTSVNIAGLAAGSYSGVITVAASGATNTPRTVPVTLTIAAATQPTTGTVTLSWVPNSESDLAGYKVYRATASGGYGAPIATVPAGTSQYVSSGLAKGFTYFFVITAYDEAGNESPYSSETSKSLY